MSKKHVLFVCWANAIRSQMAERFAKAYGSDVLVPYSVGVYPSLHIQSLTQAVMVEKNLGLEGQVSKGFDLLPRQQFDRLIDMSGQPLPERLAPLREHWPVPDPVGQSIDEFRVVRDDIESRVMRLILELRRQKREL